LLYFIDDSLQSRKQVPQGIKLLGRYVLLDDLANGLLTSDALLIHDSLYGSPREREQQLTVICHDDLHGNAVVSPCGVLDLHVTSAGSSS